MYTDNDVEVDVSNSNHCAKGAAELDASLDPHLLHRLENVKYSVVIAGHFCLAEHMQELAYDGEPEMHSFTTGAAMVRRSIDSGQASQLVLWVNDIGITPEQRESYRDTGVIPDDYLQIMQSENLGEERLTVILESTMRNKASTLLRKLFKRDPQLFDKVDSQDPGLVRCVSRGVCDPFSVEPTKDSAYVVDGPQGERLVVKEGPNPKCNLILATFFQELQKRFDPQHIFALFNDVYAYRLSLGTHVAQAVLGNPVPISVLLSDGEQIYSGVKDCIHDDLDNDD